MRLGLTQHIDRARKLPPRVVLEKKIGFHVRLGLERTRHVDRAHKLPPKVVRDKVGGVHARGHMRHQALRVAGQVLHRRRDRDHLARRRALRQAADAHTLGVRLRHCGLASDAETAITSGHMQTLDSARVQISECSKFVNA